MRVQFGDCTFDPGRRQLFRGHEPVHLSRKAFELLQLLVEHRPSAIPKALIHDRLWPKTFVSEGNLTSLVSELRTALGDDARRPRYLRTVHGFGYAFCAESAREAAAPAPAGDASSYRLIWESREVPLLGGDNILGRDPESVLWLDSPEISRNHARIRIAGAEATLEDLGSRNATFLNGTKVEAPVPLSDGDEIRLGSVRFVFRARSRSELGPTQG